MELKIRERASESLETSIHKNLIMTMRKVDIIEA